MNNLKGKNKKILAKHDDSSIDKELKKKIRCYNCNKLYSSSWKSLSNPKDNLCLDCSNKEIEKQERELAEKKKKGLIPVGFNSVDSCPNCNPCQCSINKEQCNAKISRHEFMNPYEFSDKSLLEELEIRIKKGCIRIKKDKDNWYWFEDECRWDLSRGLKKDKKTGKIVENEETEENYTVSFKFFEEIQTKYRKLEDEDKLCSICLYKPLKEKNGVFCGDCWERETKTRRTKKEFMKKTKEKES